jgi:uncharacterized protein YdhG (YjbR/CyaY superfamily)
VTDDGGLSVDAYLRALPDAQRSVLEELRATIRHAAPEAEEGIAYDMPAVRLGGRFLVSYGAYRRHVSLFPASAGVRGALGGELEPYLSGKGTIRFPAGRPIPLGLVERIVRVRVQEVQAEIDARRRA